MMEAIKAAANSRSIEEGGTLVVVHSGLGKKKNVAYSAPKLYKAKYTAPVAGINVDDDLL
jgi:hypothetical protein